MAVASTSSRLLLLTCLLAATLWPTYTSARPLSRRQLRGDDTSLVQIPAVTHNTDQSPQVAISAESESFTIAEGEELASKKPRLPPNNTYWEEHALPVVQLTLGAPYMQRSPRIRSWMQDLPAPTPALVNTQTLSASSATGTADTTVDSKPAASNPVTQLGPESELPDKPTNEASRKQIWPPRNVTVMYAKKNATSTTAQDGKSEQDDKKSDKKNKLSRKLLGWTGLHELPSSTSRKLLGLADAASSGKSLQEISAAQNSSSHKLQECRPDSSCKQATVFQADYSSSSSSSSLVLAPRVHLFVAKDSSKHDSKQTSTAVADIKTPEGKQSEASADDSVSNSVSNTAAVKVVGSRQHPAWMKTKTAQVFAAVGTEQPVGMDTSGSGTGGNSSSAVTSMVHVFAAKPSS